MSKDTPFTVSVKLPGGGGSYTGEEELLRAEEELPCPGPFPKETEEDESACPSVSEELLLQAAMKNTAAIAVALRTLRLTILFINTSCLCAKTKH
jgi:hypothetical protein